ncbi:hypothetical protein BJ508DRAFT_331273 [Ascobolus immersus RN42]|uniref:Uncharacterized protein n=1 Tax=Ascobolus immersus RN42 TaxID=1160509 RepID=A0A3N4HSM8_ASCIM|nr:hypothetical protein BJ508DRAFT_331273 [Ascobolus immersus RN42]
MVKLATNRLAAPLLFALLTFTSTFAAPTRYYELSVNPDHQAFSMGRSLLPHVPPALPPAPDDIAAYLAYLPEAVQRSGSDMGLEQDSLPAIDEEDEPELLLPNPQESPFSGQTEEPDLLLSNPLENSAPNQEPANEPALSNPPEYSEHNGEPELPRASPPEYSRHHEDTLLDSGPQVHAEPCRWADEEPEVPLANPPDNSDIGPYRPDRPVRSAESRQAHMTTVLRRMRGLMAEGVLQEASRITAQELEAMTPEERHALRERMEWAQAVIQANLRESQPLPHQFVYEQLEVVGGGATAQEELTLDDSESHSLTEMQTNLDEDEPLPRQFVHNHWHSGLNRPQQQRPLLTRIIKPVKKIGKFFHHHDKSTRDGDGENGGSH